MYTYAYVSRHTPHIFESEVVLSIYLLREYPEAGGRVHHQYLNVLPGYDVGSAGHLMDNGNLL